MVRNPRDAIHSHLAMDSAATSQSMGFEHMWEIVTVVTGAGMPMQLVDGDALVTSPQREMRNYCAAMGIDFEPDSLVFSRPPPASWRFAGKWHEGASGSSALGLPPEGRLELSNDLKQIAQAYERDHAPYCDRIRAGFGPSSRQATPGGQRG